MSADRSSEASAPASRPRRLAIALALAGAAVLLGSGLTVWTASPAPAETPPPATATEAPEPGEPEESAPPEPTPSDPGTATPEPTASPVPTAPAVPTSTAGTPSPRPTADGADAVLEAEPPAWSESERDPTSWVIAILVLLAGAVMVALLARRPSPAEPSLPTAPPVVGSVGPVGPVDSGGAGRAAARLASLESIGEAMIDAGYSVTGVRSALHDIAAVNGHPDTEIVVFPTALFVSARGLGEIRTGAVSSGHSSLSLNQIDALDDVVRSARTRPSEPEALVAGIAAVRGLRSPYSRGQRVAAYAVLSASLSVLLGASWAGVALAGALGLGVGVVLLVTSGIQRQYQALVTVGLAFAVSTAVFALSQIGLDPGVLAALIAPLVIFLPGGLLTTGVIELATGQMMAGAGRLAAGGMQLVLLAAGVVAGASLVGVPQLELEHAQNPIGALGPWLAVAIFGVGIVVYQCGRPASIAWILLVLYVAYGAQVLGDIFFGGVLSALIGAFAMTPVAYLVARQRSGPAAFASFLPAFWLLVPGALGLVGVTSILDGDSAGLTTLVTTASTMVAIMLGILAGTAVGSRLTGGGIAAAV